MDLWEADAWANWIREIAGVERDALIKPSDLARGLGLDVYQGKGLKLLGDATIATWGGKTWVAVRSGMSLERTRFAVFHELAEHALKNQAHEDLEKACNAIAGALAMPRGPFLRAVRDVGDDPKTLAPLFKVTPTAAALRLGETTQIPLAALTPSWLWIRGREIVWPAERELRRIAKTGRPGLRRVDLEPRRVMLVAEELDEAV